MSKGILDYEKIFEFYDLTWEKAYDNKTKKKKENEQRKIRRTLTRLFEQKYGKNITWDELTKEQKILFITSDDVKNYFFEERKGKTIVDSSKHFKIEQKISEKLREYLVQTVKIIDERNEYVNALFEPAKNTSKTSYDNFCKTLKSYNSQIPLPSSLKDYKGAEDSSSQESPTHLPRPYDYVQSRNLEYMEKYRNIENIVSQSTIDHICLDIILQVLEENFQLKIDTDKIEETLVFISSHSKYSDLYESESFPVTFEESLSNDGFEKYIEENNEYFNAKDFNTLIRKFDERADSIAKRIEESNYNTGITHKALDGNIMVYKCEANNFKVFFEKYREMLSKNQSSPETKLDAYLASPNEETFQEFEEEYNIYTKLLKKEYEKDMKDFAKYFEYRKWRDELKPFYTMPKVADIFQTVSGQKKIRK